MNPTAFHAYYGPRTAQDEQQIRDFLRIQAEVFPAMSPEEAVYHCANVVPPTRKWDVPTVLRWAREAQEGFNHE